MESSLRDECAISVLDKVVLVFWDNGGSRANFILGFQAGGTCEI